MGQQTINGVLCDTFNLPRDGALSITRACIGLGQLMSAHTLQCGLWLAPLKSYSSARRDRQDACIDA